MSYVDDVAHKISAKLAGRLGIPEPPEAWRAFAAQVRNETAGGDPSTRGVRNNNPLNLTDAGGTIAWPGESMSDGPFAVFETLDAGINASVQNLLAPDYERVRNSFRFGDPVALAHSIEASPWDAGHYSNNLASMIPDASDTYIGGGSSPTTIGDCPTGYARNALGICVPSHQPGFNPKSPGVDPITGAGPKAVPGGGGVAGVGSDLNPFDAIGAGFGALGTSINEIGDRVLTGTRQLVIAGVVIAAIAALSVSGVRRTLD
jgi:hypothetical protein